MSSLEVGIVGLPNVGKSTLFNAITKAGAEAANYPFCTIEPNVGIALVADERLDVLTKMYQSKKTTPASVRFVDIAGLVKGASKGEGLGNKFLEHIRQVDAIAHVVRCFEDGSVTHVSDTIDPLRDIETIETELCIADLEAVGRRISRVERAAKSGSKESKAELAVLKKLETALDEMKSARSLGLTDDELELISETNLLTLKPVLYVANVSFGQCIRAAGAGTSGIGRRGGRGDQREGRVGDSGARRGRSEGISVGLGLGSIGLGEIDRSGV